MGGVLAASASVSMTDAVTSLMGVVSTVMKTITGDAVLMTFFFKFWSINMHIGKYTISVGAVVVFCLAIGLIIKFMRGISE